MLNLSSQSTQILKLTAQEKGVGFTEAIELLVEAGYAAIIDQVIEEAVDTKISAAKEILPEKPPPADIVQESLVKPEPVPIEPVKQLQKPDKYPVQLVTETIPPVKSETVPEPPYLELDDWDTGVSKSEIFFAYLECGESRRQFAKRKGIPFGYNTLRHMESHFGIDRTTKKPVWKVNKALALCGTYCPSVTEEIFLSICKLAEGKVSGVLNLIEPGWRGVSPNDERLAAVSVLAHVVRDYGFEDIVTVKKKV